jgi:hypothetical protein
VQRFHQRKILRESRNDQRNPKAENRNPRKLVLILTLLPLD